MSTVGKFLNLLAITAVLLVPVATEAMAQDVKPGSSAQDITFPGDGETLHGTVFAPPQTGQRRPGMVLVSGSGPEPSPEQVRSFMEPLTRAGIVSLVYKRRTAGYSVTERSYSQLADDALAAVKALRGRDDVDPERVGLWGASEGAWVAPLAASRSADVHFLVLISASGVPPARQTAWQLTNSVHQSGAAGSMPETLPLKGVRLVAGLGQFPEAGYDTVPVLERTRQPVLAVWGSEDHTVPAAESMTTVQRALDRAGNNDYTLRVFPGVGHALSRSGDDFSGATEIVPEFFDLVGQWVGGLPDRTRQASVDPLPRQERVSAPVAPQSWYESTWFQLVALTVFVVAFAGYFCVAALRKFRRRDTRPVLRRPARLLAITGLLAPLALLGYVVTLLLSRSPGTVVGGFALPFLVVRILTLIALAATVALAVMWWRRRTEILGGERVRLGLLLAGGLLLAPWSVYWGLVFG